MKMGTHRTLQKKLTLRLPIPQERVDRVRVRLPIVFGVIGRGWQQELGRQALMEAFARDVPVFIPQESLPSESKLGRPRVRQVARNIFEVTNVFSLRRHRLGRRMPRLAGAVDGRLLLDVLKSAGVRDFVYWLGIADTTMLFGMPKKRLVFDCVDPCFLPELTEVHAREERLVAKSAQAAFCSAEVLFRKVRAFNRATSLLRNACSLHTYQAVWNTPTIPPRCIRESSSPVVGYMGTIDWRFDAEAVEIAARRLPGFNFVLVGRVNRDQEGRLAQLRRLKNVIFAGSVSYEEGHRYVANFDAAIIPFIPDKVNDGINPCKMYMHLVAGTPVVATRIHECTLIPELVHAAPDPRSFADAIAEAVKSDSHDAVRRRVEYGLQNTWEDRADSAAAHMLEAGLFD